MELPQPREATAVAAAATAAAATGPTLTPNEKQRRKRMVSISNVIEEAPSDKDMTSSILRDFLTMLALSFHAIFEGMAIGLEEHPDDVWELFIGTYVFFRKCSIRGNL